jgi:plasmid maintenance system antidote protein VapI
MLTAGKDRHNQRKPMKLFEHLKKKHEIKNDRNLAITLGVGHPVVSRIANGKQALSAEMILRIHETFDMPVKEIRQMIEE